MRGPRFALACALCLAAAACAESGTTPYRVSWTSSSWQPRYDDLQRGVFYRPDGTKASAVRFGTSSTCFEVYDAVIGLVRRYKFDILDLVQEGQVRDMPADLKLMALRVSNRSADLRSTFGELEVFMLPAQEDSCRVSVVRMGSDRMVNPSWDDIASILKAMVSGRPLD